MHSPPATFVFICPFCHEWAEQPRAEERHWSVCDHCRSPVVLIDANESLVKQELASTDLERRRQPASARPFLLRLLWVPVGVVLLPLHLAWLICVLTVQLIAYLIPRIESTYRKHGWRGFTRFRLSHFLIATSIVAALAGFIGRRYVREWELQREAQRIFEEQLVIYKQRAALDSAAHSLGGNITWHRASTPEPFYRARRYRDLWVFETWAAVELRCDSYTPGRPNNSLPSQNTWETSLPALLDYPYLESISIQNGSFEPGMFEDLPVSESLEAVTLKEASLPREGWEWCARSPNLRYVEFRTNPWLPVRAAPDDYSLRMLSQCPNIHTLILDHTPITAAGTAIISEMNQLEHLHLWTVEPLDTEALRNLASLKLRRLSLAGTPMTAERAEALANISELKELIVDATSYDNLRRLQKLLPDTKVRERRPSEWPYPSLPYAYSKRQMQQ